MKRTASLFAAIALAVLAFYSPPASAQDLSAWNNSVTRFEYETALMRNTTAAAAVVVNTNWASPSKAGGFNGFTDSTVFRRAVTTRTIYDTTISFPIAHFRHAPIIGPIAAPGDTTLPWIVVRVQQDTTSYSYASNSALDSVRVAIEYSYDGVQWFSESGTPTYRFDTVFMTSGQDGLQSPTLIGVEASPGEDAVQIPIKCAPELAGSQAFIANKCACMSGNYLRFIVGGAYTGQFRIAIGSWQETS